MRPKTTMRTREGRSQLFPRDRSCWCPRVWPSKSIPRFLVAVVVDPQNPPRTPRTEEKDGWYSW